MKTDKVLVIASAGGHLTQAMCATSLLSDLILVSNKKTIKQKNIHKIYKIIDTQHNPLIHFINIFFALYVLLKERPKAVFSTGGPITLPFALLCKILPFKYIHLDTLSRVIELSNTANLIHKYHLYDEIFTQWENVSKQYHIPYLGKTFDILNEVTSDIEILPADTTATILVTMGTNGYPFGRLAELLYKHPLYSSPQVKWLIQTGGFELQHPPKNGEVFNMVSRQEMEDMVKQSHLVISHCGIGSINVMLSYQKQVIFVPRIAKYNEFSDDHQLQIANEIKGKRIQVVLPEQELPEISLKELLAIKRITKPVDIINYQLATIIKDKLLT